MHTQTRKNAANALGGADDAPVADLIKSYLYGWGVEQNFIKASQLVDGLYEKVNQEDPQAMYLLGLVDHEMSYDPESGLGWIRKAAAKGYEEAIAFLKNAE